MWNPKIFNGLKMSKKATLRVGEAMVKLAAVEGLTAKQFVACSQEIVNQISQEKESIFTVSWRLKEIIVNPQGFVLLGFDDLESENSKEIVFNPDGNHVLRY